MGEMKTFRDFSSRVQEAQECSFHNRKQVERGTLGASLL